MTSRTFASETWSTNARFFEVRGWTSAGTCVHRRLDLGEQAGEVAQFHVVHRALDGAAIGMADDGNQFCAGNFAGEFHAAEDVVIQHVAGDARAENVADALVQNDFDGLARIQAAQDHGKGILAGGGGFDVGGKIAVQRMAGHKPRVARFQFRQRRCGVIAACDSLVGGAAAVSRD